jgi:hypothetical protein
LNFLTPTSDAPRPFSLDFLGATASGFVPFSGFVACGTTERSEDAVGCVGGGRGTDDWRKKKRDGDDNY